MRVEGCCCEILNAINAASMAGGARPYVTVTAHFLRSAPIAGAEDSTGGSIINLVALWFGHHGRVFLV
jgi:hypothetical protein